MIYSKRYGLLDKYFSQYIRLRDKYQCQYCKGKQFPDTMQCAHIFARNAASVRFDPDNAICVHSWCHEYLDQHSEDKWWFQARRIGEKRFHALRRRKGIPAKIDKEKIKKWLKAEIKKLDEEGEILGRH